MSFSRQINPSKLHDSQWTWHSLSRSTFSSVVIRNFFYTLIMFPVAVLCIFPLFLILSPFSRFFHLYSSLSVPIIYLILLRLSDSFTTLSLYFSLYFSSFIFVSVARVLTACSFSHSLARSPLNKWNKRENDINFNMMPNGEARRKKRNKSLAWTKISVNPAQLWNFVFLKRGRERERN